jgi:molecular chaperone DnaK
MMQASMKLGEAMYKGMNPEGAPGPGGPSADGSAGGPTQDDGVVDADYEEVDEDKKKGAR